MNSPINKIMDSPLETSYGVKCINLILDPPLRQVMQVMMSIIDGLKEAMMIL